MLKYCNCTFKWNNHKCSTAPVMNKYGWYTVVQERDSVVTKHGITLATFLPLLVPLDSSVWNCYSECYELLLLQALRFCIKSKPSIPHFPGLRASPATGPSPLGGGVNQEELCFPSGFPTHSLHNPSGKPAFKQMPKIFDAPLKEKGKRQQLFLGHWNSNPNLELMYFRFAFKNRL